MIKNNNIQKTYDLYLKTCSYISLKNFCKVLLKCKKMVTFHSNSESPQNIMVQAKNSEIHSGNVQCHPNYTVEPRDWATPFIRPPGYTGQFSRSQMIYFLYLIIFSPINMANSSNALLATNIRPKMPHYPSNVADCSYYNINCCVNITSV